MANIILPEALRAFLGPEMRRDTHWIDVRLADGRVFRRIVVEGGCVITGQGFYPIDDGPLPFEGSDIAEIYRSSLFLSVRWWLSSVRRSSARAPTSSLAVALALAILALAEVVTVRGSLALPVAVAILVVAVLVGLARHWA